MSGPSSTVQSNQNHSPGSHSLDSVASLTPPGQQTNPSLWGGKLTLIAPGPEIESNRELQTLNNGLQRAWQLADPICWILARVRCEILGLTPTRYAEVMDASSGHAVVQLENRARTHNDGKLFSEILRKWKQIADSTDTPQIKEQLNEARQELLKGLAKTHGKGIFAQYRRWRYEVGTAEFDRRSGVSYKGMWLRKQKGYLPSFSEVVELAQNTGIVPKSLTPVQLWHHPEIEAAARSWIHDGKKRDRPVPVMELHAMLACCGHNIGVTSLYSRPMDPSVKVGQRTAQQVFNFQMPEWCKVEPAFRTLKENGLLTQRQLLRREAVWEETRRLLPERFEDRVAAIARERGIDNGHLADIFGLRSTELTKPALRIFRALNSGEYVAPVSAAALAYLIGRSRTEIDGLLDHKRQDLAADLKRKSSALNPELVVERRLWNLSYENIVVPKQQIQDLEWGRDQRPEAQRELLTKIRAVGEAHVKSLIVKLIAQNDFESVSSAMSTLIDRFGAAPLSRDIQSSAYTVGSIARGEEIPALPVLRGYLERMQVPMSLNLRLDWQDQYARHLAGEERGDLNRVLQGLIGQESASRRDLFTERGVPYQSGSRPLKLLSALGAVSEEHLQKLLADLGCEAGTPRHQLIMSIYQRGNISDGLKTWIEQLKESGNKTLASEIRALAEYVREQSGLPSSDLNQLIEKASSINRLPGKSTAEQKLPENTHRMIALLDLLPGITRSELENLGGSPHSAASKIRTTFASHISAIEAQGIDRKTLIAMAAAIAPVKVVSRGYLQQGFEQSLEMPAFAPGVAALLAASGSHDFAHKLHRLRIDACNAFQEVGILPNGLMIEMRVWGIRAQDLSFDKKQLQSVLWSSQDREHQQQLVEGIYEIVSKQIFSALRAEDRRQRQSEELKTWATQRLPHIETCLTVLKRTNIAATLVEVQHDIKAARLEAAEAAAMKAREQELRRQREAPKPEWQMQSQDRFLPFDRKLTLIAERLKTGEQVSNAQMKVLFPQQAQVIDRISRNFDATDRRGEAAWYIASTIFFDDPEAALLKIDTLLTNRSVAKYPGPQHFANVAQFHASLNGRRDLSTASMGLYFGDYAYVVS